MGRLSIIIPSRSDPHLQHTIDDIRKNAEGEYEIVVVLDGKPQEVKNADKVIFLEGHKGMRAAVNKGVEESNGFYIMKIDAHCMFDKGFDIKLFPINDNWVVTPVRYRLDVDNWCISSDDPRPIIYERLVIDNPDKVGGVEWRSRNRGREDILVDENMIFQGSCWLMSRNHWNRLGGLSEEGYGTFAQEPAEIALKTWLSGGRVMVNKHTWYAHKHRKYGRTYSPLKDNEIQKGNLYARDFWVNNRWKERVFDIEWLMKRFGL